MKKKLIFCTYNLCIGGIEKALIEILKSLDLNKYEITLLLEEKSGELLDFIPNNIRTIEYKVYKNKNVLLRKAKNFLMQLKFKFKYGNSFDLAVCYAPYSLACNKVTRLASKNRALYIHGNYPMIYKYDEKKIREFFSDKHLSTMNHLIFVSNEAEKDFLKYYPDLENKTKVINNLVDAKGIVKLSKAKIELKKDKDKTLLVFVGRLEEESKRISRQLDLIEYLNNKKIAVELWIIGDGNEKKLYQRTIKDKNLKNVKMLGAKTNPYPYLAEADYLLLTSDYEGFPVVFNEALVLNKQVISTIEVSDEEILSKEKFFTLSPSNLNKEALKIIKAKKQINYKKVNFDKLNKNRLKRIEELIGDEDV